MRDAPVKNSRLCACGCGGTTSLATKSEPSRGRIKGEPCRFIAGHNSPPLAERFWAKVEKRQGGCWIWTATKRHGYGSIRDRGKNRQAHRVSYELAVGPVPPGLEIDHLCENRACVNPAHLEAVDHRTNMLRTASTGAAINSVKTHCLKGHPLDEENTYWTPSGNRNCRICRLDASRRYEARKAAA